jgi:SHS2 domain-containing protein
MSRTRYRIFDHTADIGIAVENASLEGLFEDAAFGMFDLIGDLNRIESREEIRVDLEAETLEELFADWLRELLFRFETDLIVLKYFHVRMRSHRTLSGQASGEVYDPNRHELYRELKAVTYHELRVEQVQGIWRGSVIFDV